ncbi:hypothetical protein NLJ89_g6211 [Agrocybe chaxingu]|uniref:Uncharacterized protein n=1 Tax=Agrocybe chaxingu TaxID=84603 RepID=A0A9W8JZK3_9AGAR|nr:hypothetical protein NLJ89_g6211 [Agrocybe chaxingu]
MSPFDLLIDILDESKPEYSAYRPKLYEENNKKLDMILDHIAGAEAGKRIAAITPSQQQKQQTEGTQ